mmetsp:Transcript_4833/g.7991  ORF Transcript_4833/g.7991 Transcript_4833/m.7991 type:complete len:173 (+) Transcript_4833:147-665(+)|eukprot:CAMPEP_0119010176 /NCGR_PEP_ID=MMETSP1176-20130426/4846_1 /TAXON_ID=265551 /ORGANISM="Synedropsis recta cf, Strain CCMP1620" /LENGTH=172 /DNA_ID=CAMNT_0006962803 /DNA_START=127 /DNA_END=645 /DNA_ORIENTATION=-
MSALDLSRRTASAYPPRFSAGNMQKAAQIAALVIGIFFLHNALFHDYRMEEVQYLSAMGKSAEEIKAFVPETSMERREKIKQDKSDLEDLKVDVALLKREISNLKKRVEEQDEYDTKRHNKDEGAEAGGGESLDKLRFQEEEEGEVEAAANKRHLMTGNNDKKVETTTVTQK